MLSTSSNFEVAKLFLLELKFDSFKDFFEVSEFHTGAVLFCCSSIKPQKSVLIEHSGFLV